MCPQAYKKETLGREALLREKEEAILMERKRRYGAPHVSTMKYGPTCCDVAVHESLPFSSRIAACVRGAISSN